MKKIIVLAVALLFLVLISSFQNLDRKSYVIINGTWFKAEFANTIQEKEIGLSKYKSIGDDFALVFPFEKSEKHVFWMKNMHFPIDIIFANNSKIIKIYENVLPPVSEFSQLRLYSPQENSDTVIEVNAGISRRYNFRIGDQIKIIK